MSDDNDLMGMDEAIAKAVGEQPADVQASVSADAPDTSLDDAANNSPAPVAKEHGGKDRAEDGNFKAKAQDADASKVSPEAKPGEAKEGPKDKADLTLDAPASWRKEAKEQWSALPLPIKAEIAKREREAQSALTEANQKLASREKDGQDLDRVLTPFAQQWGAKGIRTAEAVAQTLQRAAYAYSKPREFIQEFARENGIDLGNLTQGQEGTYQDPELARVTAELSGIKQQFTQFTQSQQQNAQQQFASAVNAFADAKDEAGEAKHPHFSKVQDLMVNLMPRLNATEPNLSPSEKLAKAYDMACRAHPEVWQTMREDMLVKSQSNQVQQQAQAAQAAKARAISPASSALAASGMDASMRGKSLDEVIAHAMRQNPDRV